MKMTGGRSSKASAWELKRCFFSMVLASSKQPALVPVLKKSWLLGNMGGKSGNSQDFSWDLMEFMGFFPLIPRRLSTWMTWRNHFLICVFLGRVTNLSQNRKRRPERLFQDGRIFTHDLQSGFPCIDPQKNEMKNGCNAFLGANTNISGCCCYTACSNWDGKAREIKRISLCKATWTNRTQACATADTLENYWLELEPKES